MAKKQKFFKYLLASSAIASVVASLGSSSVAFGGAVEHGVWMRRNAALGDNAVVENWNEINERGKVVNAGDFIDAPNNKAITYGADGLTLTANRAGVDITAINGNGRLRVTADLSIGSIIGGLPITITTGKRLTLTGTPSVADQHGFAALANTCTGLGDVTLAGAGSTLVVHSADGRDIVVGNVLAGTNHQGVLTFETGGSVGAIGADDNKLHTVNIGHAGGAATVTLNGYVYADNIKLANNVSTLNVGIGKIIKGNILNTVGRNNRGTLTFLGAGTVIGDIGADGARLAQINVKLDDVVLNGNVFTNELALDADRIVQIRGNFTGVVDFNGGGVLTFNGADVDPHTGNIISYTFNSAIQHGDKGTLRVFTNLTATNADIGNIKTIHIGSVLGANALTIDAGDVNLLGRVNDHAYPVAVNQAINFGHVDSRLILQNTANANKTITFNANLDPDPLAAAASTKGIIEIGSVIGGKTLTIDGGAFSLGTANHKLKNVKFFGDGKIDIVPTINAQNIELDVAELTSLGVVNGNILFNRATVFNANDNITGNVHFKGHNGTIKLADGKIIDGSITMQGGGEGILTFEGDGIVTGDIGTAEPALDRLIHQININAVGKDVILRQNVYTDELNFVDASTVKIGGNFKGGVDFNQPVLGAVNGILEFNGAVGPYTFNSTILHGDHGTLNVNANLQATHKDIGKIKTINIGAVGGGNNKTLLIDASADDVHLLDDVGGGGNQAINFGNAISALSLHTENNNRTITFHNNLPGFAGGGGFMLMDSKNAILTLQSAAGGVKILGAVNNLTSLVIGGKVTISGGVNGLDISHADRLSLVNGAEFTDNSATSARIENIRIGVVGVGPATYILDAEHGDFNLNAFADDQIVFLDPDSWLVLRNNHAGNKTITLRNDLNPDDSDTGIVELHSVVAGKTLKIDGAGTSLGTAVNNLKKVIFSGAGTFKIVPTIHSKNIELNVNVLELGDVNSNIFFAKNTVLTANGNITGSVDFQNNDGTVRLAHTKNITGSVTSTGGVNGTLEFLGDGTVTSPITNLKMLKAGVGEVRLVDGNHNIKEIQGNGGNNLIFADSFNLTGSINSTGGVAVGLIFKGNNGVSGVVGTEKSPVGTIRVQDGNTRFGDKVQTDNNQDIIISNWAIAEFANTVTTRDIKGEAAGQGTVKFSNAKEAITVSSAIGAGNSVYTLEIAGADVAITQAVSAKNISFSNAKEATLTLNGTNTVDGIRTVGNNVHTLALAADFITGLQDIGSEKNRLKSIKLLGDHKITINSGVYSDVSTKTNNIGKVAFNTDRSFAYDLGTDKLRLSDVTFDNNATVRGDVYSKQITIASDKTATFAGTKNRTISVPNLTVDGSSLSRLLKSFAYSTQIDSDGIKNAGIAKFDNAVPVDAKINGGKVTFADNVWFKQTADGIEVSFAADKFVILEQNIKFANIKADKAKIVILPKTAAITGNLAAKDFTVDLAANKLQYTGKAQLTEKIELVTAYDTLSGTGGNIEVQKDSELDLSKADQLIIKVNAQTDVNKIPKGGAQYFVISSVDDKGLVAIDNSKVSLDSTGEQNRFVKWSMDYSDLKLYITDISNKVLVKDSAKYAPHEQEFVNKQLLNATGDAVKFRGQLGKMDQKNAHLAIEKLLPGNEHSIGESLAKTSAIMGALISQTAIQIASRQYMRMHNPASYIGSGDDDQVMYGVWGSPFYGTACQEMYEGVSGYKSKSAGGIVGFDGLVNDNLLLGTAYSRINTQMSHQNQKVGDKTNGKTNIFSLYSLYNFPNNWFNEAIASYGITRVKNSEGRLIATNVRTVTALETAAAKYKSISYSGQLLAGYNYQASEKLMITPTIGLRYSQFKDAGYTETGTKFQNLAVKKRSYNKLEGILGLRTAITLKVNEVLLIPELHGYVNHDFKGKAPIIYARLDGINEPLPTRLVKPAKTSFTVGTGLTAKYDMMECGVTYNANIASKYIGHQGSLKVKVNF